MISLAEAIKTSKPLRTPLLCLTKFLLSPLTSKSPILRRAAYDAYPNSYLVTGTDEKYVVSTKDKGTGRLLFQKGVVEFEKFLAALDLLSRLREPAPQHLIDVGANIGIIVIPALARGIVKSATAIEPHPENIRLLRTNLALNGVDARAVVLGQAVGVDSNAILLLNESSTDSSIHSIGSSGIKVASSRLDDVEQPRRDALLWMDIEGYEGHALHGAAQLLASGMPVVSEFNPRFLKESGGMTRFKDALKGRRIYDLKHAAGAKETTLDALESEYNEYPLWTDILAVAE